MVLDRSYHFGILIEVLKFFLYVSAFYYYNLRNRTLRIRTGFYELFGLLQQCKLILNAQSFIKENRFASAILTQLTILTWLFILMKASTTTLPLKWAWTFKFLLVYWLFIIRSKFKCAFLIGVALAVAVYPYILPINLDWI